MVLPPDVAGEQVVEARDRVPPRHLPGRFEPFGVLVEHRVDDVGECLVAVEQAVSAGQDVALEPALALVLAEHLHHPPGRGQVLVDGLHGRVPLLAGGLVDGWGESVGGGLVRAEDAEVVRVVPDHPRQPLAQHAGRFPGSRTPLGRVDRLRVLVEVREPQRDGELSAVAGRVRAHPPIPVRGDRDRGRAGGAGHVEQLVRAVGRQPVLEDPQVLGIVADLGERHLVGPPGALHGEPVDHRRAGPAFRAAQHDRRPRRPALQGAGRRGGLDVRDPVQHLVQHAGEPGVGLPRVLAVEADGDHERLVAVAAQQRDQLVLGDAGQHRRVGDLVPVQVQDRQHHPVRGGVEELVAVPRGRQRPGLRLPVTDHTGDQQIRVVERGPVGVHQGVAQLAALVDRPRRVRGRVRGDPAGEGELPEQRPQPLLGAVDARVAFGVGAVQVGVGDHARSAVPGPGHVQGVQVAVADGAVQVGVEEVQARGGAPMPQQPRLDVVPAEAVAQQRVTLQVDLPDAQIVRRPPPRIHRRQLLGGGISGAVRPRGGCRCGGHGRSPSDPRPLGSRQVRMTGVMVLPPG